MARSVKLDEVLSRRMAHPLVVRGYSVLTVRDQGWGGLDDSALWPLVQKENIFFITADKGFGDIRRFPPGTHAGVLVLRPGRESVPEFAALLETVLQSHTVDGLVGAVAVATPRGLRVRRET